MKGDANIPEQKKGPFGWRKILNKLITRQNRQWQVKGLDEEMGTIEFTGEEKVVKMNCKLKTVDLIACNEEGEQFTFRVIGYQLEE